MGGACRGAHLMVVWIDGADWPIARTTRMMQAMYVTALMDLVVGLSLVELLHGTRPGYGTLSYLT